MKIALVIPVYNDWTSLKMILPDIVSNLKSITSDFKIFAVNDCSTFTYPFAEFENVENFQVIHLVRNLGHQKAIAIGLSFLNDHYDADCIIVMDGDGEDRPSDIPKLVGKFAEMAGESIVFARRTQRHEGLLFKLMYFIYKRIFRILTGKTINFGNFSIIPGNSLNKIVHVSEIWNHYSGGIIRSKLSYTDLPLEKGIRVHGTSKMNAVALIVHGISSVAVHLDVVSVRLLMFAASLIGFVFMSFLFVLYVKFFTQVVIPGWTTIAFVGLSIVFLQIFFICLMLTFMVLFYRTQRQFLPAKEFELFIQKTNL